MLSVVFVVVATVSLALLPVVAPLGVFQSSTESQRLALFGLALFLVAGVSRFVNTRTRLSRSDKASQVTGRALLAD